MNLEQLLAPSGLYVVSRQEPYLDFVSAKLVQEQYFPAVSEAIKMAHAEFTVKPSARTCICCTLEGGIELLIDLCYKPFTSRKNRIVSGSDLLLRNADQTSINQLGFHILDDNIWAPGRFRLAGERYITDYRPSAKYIEELINLIETNSFKPHQEKAVPHILAYSV